MFFQSKYDVIIIMLFKTDIFQNLRKTNDHDIVDILLNSKPFSEYGI